jgi:hypothetical protein
MRRDTLTIGGVALISVAIGVVVFLSGAVTNRSSVVTVPFTTLIQGRQSAVARRVNYFITSSAQLSEIWKVVNASGTPPKVDFKKQAVIAVFAGNESSSSIAVAKIEDTNARMVSIAIAKPDCTANADASPYEIVAVPTTSLPLAHTDIPTTVDCPK